MKKKTTKVITPATTVKKTAFFLSPTGETKAIHARLSLPVKKKIDAMALEMNVHQWVIINNLCATGLESLGK